MRYRDTGTYVGGGDRFPFCEAPGDLARREFLTCRSRQKFRNMRKSDAHILGTHLCPHS